MREYNEIGIFKVIDRWIFLLKICPNYEQHQKHIKKDLFQNFLIITCKKGFKNPVFTRVFLGEGRNEGCPLKGIDTIYNNTLQPIRMTVEMKVAR